MLFSNVILLQEKVKRRKNVKTPICTLWLRLSIVLVTNTMHSLWETGQTVFYQKGRLKCCWEWGYKETAKNVDKDTVTKQWRATTKMGDSLKHRDATAMVIQYYCSAHKCSLVKENLQKCVLNERLDTPQSTLCAEHNIKQHSPVTQSW